jgi:hypothetical protein
MSGGGAREAEEGGHEGKEKEPDLGWRPQWGVEERKEDTVHLRNGHEPTATTRDYTKAAGCASISSGKVTR